MKIFSKLWTVELKFLLACLVCLNISMLPLQNLESEETKLIISAQMSRICSVTIKQVIPFLDILPQKDCKTAHFFPHVLSIFLTYNGSSSIKLIILPGEAVKEKHNRFHFQSVKNSNHCMFCFLVNSETKAHIPEFGTIFQYAHDISDPIVFKEFKIGIKIPASEVSSIEPGNYNCSLKAVIIEGD